MSQIPNIGSLKGKWTYRSFLNDPDLSTQFNDLEFGRAFKLLRSHREGFDDQCTRWRKIDTQIRMRGHQPNLAGIEPSCACSEIIAPARKIGLVGGHEVGKSGASLLRRRGVEHHTDQPSPGIVFDDHYWWIGFH